MADRKVSALTSLAGADAASGDLVHVVDVSEAADADKNKSITRDELRNAMMPIIASYTPTFSAGFGTVTNIQYYYALHNGVMHIWGRHQDGTVAASPCTISLPSGYQVHTSITSVVFLGLFQRPAYTTARYGVIATGADTFLEISRLDAAGGADPLTVMNGNSGLGSNEIQTFYACVPVEAV